jgi:CRP-like cAMP-binding protein
MNPPQDFVQRLPLKLAQVCEQTENEPGSLLFLTGDRPTRMFVILQGEVILERQNQNGHSICLQRCNGGLLAEASLSARAYHCDARIIRPTRMMQIPISALRRHLLNDSEFALHWIYMLSQEVRRLRLQNERLALPKVQDRLLHLIATEGRESHYELGGPLKQLAQQLGVTHEALYRALSSLETQGKLKRSAGGLKLLTS